MRLIRDLQRKRKMEERKKVGKGLALGTLVGGLLGSAAGLLLAPDSGKNTRKKIQESAVDVKNNVQKNIDEAKDNMGNTLTDKKTKIQEAVQKLRTMGKCSQEEAAVAEDQPTQEEENKE